MIKEVCRACRSIDQPFIEPLTGEGFDYLWDHGRIMCPQQIEDTLFGSKYRYVELPPPDKCPFMTEQVIGQETKPC
jgi:hypothetical protein